MHLIFHMQQDRIKMATAIWQFRKVFKTAELDRQGRLAVNDACRRRFAHGASPKPTPENLLEAAIENEEFASSTWRSHDTEYYSACGHDDMQAEHREWAQKYALELRAAHSYLTKPPCLLSHLTVDDLMEEIAARPDAA